MRDAVSATEEQHKYQQPFRATGKRYHFHNATKYAIRRNPYSVVLNFGLLIFTFTTS